MKKIKNNYGYFPKTNQPLILLRNFSIVIPDKDIDFHYVDKLFLDVFDLDCNKLSYDKKSKPFYSLIERYFYLANLIQSYSGIPSFSIGTILNVNIIENIDNKYEIKFDSYVPYIEHMNNEIRIKIYTGCMFVIQCILSKDEKKLYIYLEKFFQSSIKKIRIINNQGDSTVPILKAAFDRDVPFVKLFDKTYQLGWGCKGTLIHGSMIESDALIGSQIAHNKFKAARLLKSAGLPVTNSCLITDETKLNDYAEKIGWPVVVKPIDRDRSEGVTTSITDFGSLKGAYQFAKKYSSNIMLEKHVEGDVYRIALINNKLLFVAKRLPKRVVGDGSKSIGQLIDEKNYIQKKKAPWLRLKPFPKDNEASECLANQGYTFNTILGKGKSAYLREIQRVEEGGAPENFTKNIHPDNVELARKISNIFRLKSIGIDLMSQDIAKPWHVNDAKILEVNYTPSIENHYQPWRTEDTKLFVSNIVPDDGRIPVSVYVGGKLAWSQGWKYFIELNGENKTTFIINHETIYRSEKNKIILEGDGFFHRCQSLLKDPVLEYLIVVVQTDELMDSMPFDKVSEVTIVDKKLVNSLSQKPIPEASVEKIIHYLKSFLT